jgi:hypothetical protein
MAIVLLAPDANDVGYGRPGWDRSPYEKIGRLHEYQGKHFRPTFSADLIHFSLLTVLRRLS